jgi:hypothetical protein
MRRNGFPRSTQGSIQSAQRKPGGPKRAYSEFVLIVAQPVLLVVVLILVYPALIGS